MESGTSTSEQPPATPVDNQRGRWWFVHVSIIAAFVLFFLFVSLLYWNWLRIDEPGSVIIVSGNQASAGTLIEVEGLNLDQPLRLELTEENKFSGRIYLTPGLYTLSVIQEGEVRHQRQISALAGLEMRLRLDPSAEASVQPR